ncbi:FHA domain-containing protein [Sulfuriferula thiophila]|uniref:FHA domain-containing protein n=1 Tax=Sulfuriferula thiophila TaxID=1781211 RepID=UPI000F609A1E|nr:FHA domain-containing protein [Sulfuriferula thiophila]
MAKLVVSVNGEVQGHYFLDKDRFVLGRKEDNDIFLDDPNVSKFHAAIITIGNDQVLEDTNSGNGVQVNGSKVTKHILQNNDIVEIGEYQLKYINQRATSNMDFDKTMMLESAPWQVDELSEGAGPVAKPQLATALSSARAVNANFPLGGVKDRYAGKETLISRPLKTFGQPGQHLAMISRRPHGYYVTHVEGKQPTRLNGRSIGTQPHLLQENDLIEVADKKLIFFMK